MQQTTGQQSIDVSPFTFRAAVSTINQDRRTVDVVFSTGAAVERYDFATGKQYLEKLSMNPSHVRLERLNKAAPVLDAHSAFSIADVMGAVVEDSARFVSGAGVATIRFSRREAVEPVWLDVLDGIIRNVSIGYRVYLYVEEGRGGERQLPIRTAVDWEPFEISLVPMPADMGARVRGDQARSLANECVLVRNAAGGCGCARPDDRARLVRLEAARRVGRERYAAH